MNNNKQAQVFHFDVFGKRQDKYDFLENHSIDDIKWNELQPENPNYFLVAKDFEGKGEYEMGFKIDEIFNLNASGIKTQRDDASIKFSKTECDEIKNDFLNLMDIDLRNKYGFKDVRDWKIEFAKADLKRNQIIADSLLYRPFDIRFMNYTGKTKGIMGYPRYDVMKHLVKENLALLSCRQQSSFDFQHVLLTNHIADMCSVSLQTKETGYIFPLYLYPETNAQQTIGQTTERTPNLNSEIVKQLAEKLGLNFVPEKEPEGNVCFVNNAEVRPDYKTTFSPIDIVDYIYAVLHSPAYREKYKEFLKIDFPRVPYPKDAETFWQLVELGGEIRQIHLLESPKVNQFITSYPVDGDNIVGKVVFEDGRVYINYQKASHSGRLEGLQYFDGVPLIAWEFYIGGYQPAQKWLKDRKGRTLNFEDIIHYQKIIVALTETHRLMQEIDKVGVE